MFIRSSELPFSIEDVFQYHARPGAIDRLIPIWEKIRIEERSANIERGARVVLQSRLFGMPQTWVAEHTQYDPPQLFEDTMLNGPFPHWVHQHRMKSVDSSSSVLTDSIEYQLPLQPFSNVARSWVIGQLETMFRYRHSVTEQDLRLGEFLGGFTGNRRLRIGITGSNGLIGNRLCALASVLGHEIVRIERASAKYDSDRSKAKLGTRVVWDTSKGFDNTNSMERLDAVIHLAAFGIADKRWTNETKEKIRDSRVESTTILIRHLHALHAPPKAFVSASGVGLYGNRGDEPCPESQSIGDGFLPSVAQQWEEAAMRFASPTVRSSVLDHNSYRVAIGRLGVVLHPNQGALAKMLPLFRWGLGGRMGQGNQYWNWIHVDDAAAAFLYLATDPAANGPYNLVAPHCPTNLEFSLSLARAIRRPCMLPVPAFALRLVMGEMVDELLLASTRAIPTRLQSVGFPFRAERLDNAWPLLLPDAVI